MPIIDGVEYVQALPLDIPKLGKYIRDAKGEGRSMTQFAEICKVKSQSTFSRIMNGKIRKPLDADVIKAIVDNRCDPEHNWLDYEVMMRANGMIPKERADRLKDPDPDRSRYARQRLEEDRNSTGFKNLVFRELSARGYLIGGDGFLSNILPEGDFDFPPVMKSFGYYLEKNNSIKKDRSFSQIAEEEETRYWLFLTVQTENDDERDIRFEYRSGMRRLSLLFLRDAWEPDTLKGIRYSFVFFSKAVFDYYKERLKQAEVNGRISLLLADPEGDGEIVEEFFLPRKSGIVPKSLFSEEKVIRKAAEDDEEWNEDWD